jgi:RNase P/RNase MRP subunit POP5
MNTMVVFLVKSGNGSEAEVFSVEVSGTIRDIEKPAVY